jgi:hypothetical protein
MEKIDFKNLPNTSTPFTAEIFNQLQTNVENLTLSFIPEEEQ